MASASSSLSFSYLLSVSYNNNNNNNNNYCRSSVTKHSNFPSSSSSLSRAFRCSFTSEATPTPRKRHWKQGEYPGEFLNPTTTNNNVSTVQERSNNLYSSSEPTTPSPRKKHWKRGEFPGESLKNNSKTVIKNVKKKMDKKIASKAWANTVTEALSHHILNKQWLQALHVFQMLRQQSFYQPKQGTYMKLILLLGRSSQPHRARLLFNQMSQEGCPPTAQLYTALLAAYCRTNLIPEAFSVLQEMKSIPHCQPDVFTYSTLIKACVDASRFDLLESLYTEMDQRFITPNTVTQNIVLSGYGKAAKYDQMEKVLLGMLQSTTCKPDVWTMNTILSLFGNKGQIELMEKWYEKFRAFGIEPETRSFNILIGAYGKKRMYDKMSTVMEYMRKLSFPWTTSTYNNVIEAFADVGDAKNMEYTFDQMRAEGMKSDTKTFCCLIRGYANAGLFHKVVSSVQLAGKFDIPENTTFHNAVISACAKANDLMEMVRVFKRMKDKQCQPDSTTYSIMVDAYTKEGMLDKVFELEQEKQMMPQPEPENLSEGD